MNYMYKHIYVGWLCFTSHRQRGHLEMAPPFTVPCEGREARFLHRPPTGIEPRTVAWQSITLPLRHANSTANTYTHALYIYMYTYTHALYIYMYINLQRKSNIQVLY